MKKILHFNTILFSSYGHRDHDKSASRPEVRWFPEGEARVCFRPKREVLHAPCLLLALETQHRLGCFYDLAKGLKHPKGPST